MDSLGPFSPYTVEATTSQWREAQRKHDEQVLAQANASTQKRVNDLRSEISAVNDLVAQIIELLDDARDRDLTASQITSESHRLLVALQEKLGQLATDQQAEVHDTKVRDEAASRHSERFTIIVTAVSIVVSLVLGVLVAHFLHW